jgi:hypothetical protein
LSGGSGSDIRIRLTKVNLEGLSVQALSMVALPYRRSPPVGSTAISAAAWIAIGCFVLLGFAVLMVLWPRRDWEFSLAPDQFVATYLEPAEGDPLALHLIERDLALHMGRSAELNRRQLRTLMGVFRVGAVLLVLEVLAWVVALVAQR